METRNRPPPPRGRSFFYVGIFRKKTSKSAKLMDERYICNNLNQMYRFFHFLTKKKSTNVFENGMEGLILFVH